MVIHCVGSSIGGAFGCDPNGCGFESRPTPHNAERETYLPTLVFVASVAARRFLLLPVTQRIESYPAKVVVGGSNPLGESIFN